MKNRRNNQNKLNPKHISIRKTFIPNNLSKLNKPHLRASGLSLLPLALRPGLLLAGGKCFALLLFVFVASFIIQNSYVNDVSAASLTLTIPSSISLDINPNSNNGFSKSSPSTLSVKTDVSYGYSLSIKTKDAANSNNLINGSTKLSSIGSAMNESDFSSTAGNNTWGYLPSKLAGSNNSNFQPGPTSEPTILDTTNSSTEGTDYNFTLAAKIDNTIPTGNYTNTFVLTATSNEPPYDGIMQDWDGCDSLPQETQTLKLLDTRDNKIYTVAKLADGKCWMTKNLEIGKAGGETKLTSEDSDVASDFTLPASSTSGFENSDTANIYIDPTYGGYYTWYAATAGEGNENMYTDDTSHSICPKGWRLPSNSEYSNLVTEQGEADMTKSPANFLFGGWQWRGSASKQGERGIYWSSTGAGIMATALYSNYTGYAYYLYVLNDGRVGTESGSRVYGYSVRCVSRSTDPKTINSLKYMQDWGELSEEEKVEVSDSMESEKTYQLIDKRDNKTYTLAKLKDGKVWMTKNLEIGKKGEETKLTPEDSDIESDFTLPASSTSGFIDSNHNIANVYIDSTYGGYYTWYAATAGEGTSGKDSGDTTHSICPSGWKLPTKLEYSTLVSSQGSTNLTNSPTNFLLSGLYRYSSASNQRSGGFYWSSTAYNYYGTYFLLVNSNSADPNGGEFFTNFYFKENGYSVRCMARVPEKKSYSITYDPGLDDCGNALNSSRIQNMPSPNPQTGTTTAESVTLDELTPTADGYILKFKSWCDVKPTNFGTCTGNSYQPGASFPVNDTTTLWAIWDLTSDKTTTCEVL